MEHQGSSSESERDHPVQKDVFSVRCSSKPFSGEVVDVLTALYQKGMIGWGRRHAREIETAISATGLSRSQVKVGCKWYTCVYLMVTVKH